MPARFNSLGISFQYPDNWKLDDTEAISGQQSVTVYSPGGAFWSVAIHDDRLQDRVEAAELIATAVAALRQEYEGLESEPVDEVIAGHRLSGCDLAFYCLDLTNTARIRCLQGVHASYMIYCQAEDREYEQVKRVFEAMTLTLLNSLPLS